MGNSFSSGNNVFVQLDKQVYFAGDQVRGNVCLNVLEPFESPRLHLKVKGEEETNWTETRTRTVSRNGESHSESYTEYFSGSATIFKIDMPLPLPSSSLKPGQYQFSFATILPSNIPGTFKASVDGGKAEIEYTVEAHCEVPGMFKRDLKHKVPIVIRQRFEAPIRNQYRLEETNIKTCCCIDKGQASAEVNVQKDAYVAGEVAEAAASVNNNTTAAFHNIKFALLWDLKLSSNSGRKHTTREVGSWLQPGVPPNTSTSQQFYKLPLPNDLRLSTRSSLIESSYSLRFELKAGALTKNLKVDMPLTIYEAQPAVEVWFAEPPPYWTPQVVMPTYNFQLPSAPPIPPMPMEAMSAGGPAGYPSPAPPQGYNGQGAPIPQGYPSAAAGYTQPPGPPTGYSSAPAGAPYPSPGVPAGYPNPVYAGGYPSGPPAVQGGYPPVTTPPYGNPN